MVWLCHTIIFIIYTISLSTSYYILAKFIIFHLNSPVKNIIFLLSCKYIFILSLFYYNISIYYFVVLLFIIMYNFHFVKVLDILQSKICTHHNFVNIIYLIPIYFIILFIFLIIFIIYIYYFIIYFDFSFNS